MSRSPQEKLIVEIANEQSKLRIPRKRMADVVRNVLRGEGIHTALVSVAVVDDATIHRLNCQYLDHDYPTDVLSFLLERNSKHLEGEVIVSADTARRTAADIGWSAQRELLLYVIHGVLHLTGYDDRRKRDRAEMREREKFYLDQADITAK